MIRRSVGLCYYVRAYPLVPESLRPHLGDYQIRMYSQLCFHIWYTCHIDTGVPTVSASVCKPTFMYGNLPNGALSGSGTKGWLY